MNSKYSNQETYCPVHLKDHSTEAEQVFDKQDLLLLLLLVIAVVVVVVR